GVGGAAAPPRMFGARLAGDAVGALVPSARLAGEPLRVALVRGGGATTSAATAGVALDRLLELIGNMLAVLAYVAVFAGSRGATHAPWALALAMLVLLAMLAMPLRDLRRGRPPFGVLRRVAPLRLTARLQPWLAGLARVEQHVGAIVRDQPSRLLAGLALTLAVELLIIAQYHALLTAFGVGLDLPALLLVLMTGGLANAAPTPAGLGAMEAAQVMAVGAATGRPELGFVVGVIVRLHSLLLLAAGGVALVWLGAAPRAARADAERAVG
ncbi:MAG: lysylphosphatidylglycerol synthase domain-containing protein, partial [Deltaproteobacteria bacterium]|nr:lysylphosphatidylglycerol synthase domain-containing protein [Deltaproteobacteria bacterium]